MANTDSTGSQLLEAAEDEVTLRAPVKPVRPVSPPRLADALPPMRGMGEVPPLPRSRTPNGTSQNLAVRGGPQVRISTAPPSRAVSIPPLPRATRPPPLPPMRASRDQLDTPTIDAHVPVPPRAAPPLLPVPRISSTSMPTLDARSGPPPLPSPSQSGELPIATRPTRPSLPPPLRASTPHREPRASSPPPLPVAAPFTPAVPDMTSSQPWFEESQRHPTTERGDAKEDEVWVGTVHVPRQPATRALLRKLALPTLGFVVLGVAIGGFFAYRGEHTSQPPAPATSAAALAGADPVIVAPTPPVPVPVPVPAPAPAAEPALAAPPVATAFIEVRIDSTPQGATVMLVDRGKTTFLGTTPVSAAVDPARSYDLVFTYANRPTQLEHLDPTATTRMTVVLGRKPAATPPAPAAALHAAVKPVPAVKASPVVASATASAGGTLMISSKPPCEIFVDGKPTGLTTPQRSIALAAGNHKVTLINAAQSIKKTVAVTIAADQATKVIQDLMPR